MDGWMTKELNLRSAKTVYLIRHRVKEAGEGCESLRLRLKKITPPLMFKRNLLGQRCL